MGWATCKGKCLANIQTIFEFAEKKRASRLDKGDQIFSNGRSCQAGNRTLIVSAQVSSQHGRGKGTTWHANIRHYVT